MKHFGKCALCGVERELTFEHIPPRNAFNDKRVKLVSGETFFENMQAGEEAKAFSELKYENAQKGKGGYTLCRECNNNTGTWYGNDFIVFSQMVANIKASLGEPYESGIECYNLKIKPLNILKQVSSMFCSVNYSNKAKDMEHLRQFVLDRHAHDLGDCKIGVFCFAKGIERQYPFSYLGHIGDLTNSCCFSEIISNPFGFVLLGGGTNAFPYPVTEITDFSKFSFNEEITINISMPMYETKDMTPGLVFGF